jgi:CDP-glucose 4,6-dehydratase
MDSGQAYNFGPLLVDSYTVEELVQRFVVAWGQKPKAIHVRERSDAPDMNTLTLDSTKARSALGWKPRYGFDTAVEETARWYRGFAEDPGVDQARRMTSGQIRRFCAESTRH